MRQLARTVTDQKPFQIAFERVQAIAGQIERLGRGSRVENREDSFDGVQEIGANPAAVGALIEAL